MVDQVRELSARVKALDRSIRSEKKAQVRRQSDRNEARAIVDSYFRDIRERAALGGAGPEPLSTVDDLMHRLLDASHKHSASSTYTSILKALVSGLLVLEKEVLLGPQTSVDTPFERTDTLIVETLAQVLPSAARAYEQGLRDLMGPQRLSWRGPATDLRESLREVLDHLAPDEDVTGEPGFKLEKNTTGPTMKQKVRHVLKKRGLSKSATKAPEGAAEAVEGIVGGFVRSVYTRSSVSTHTPTERDEVLRVHEYVRAALCELLEVHANAQAGPT